MTQSLALNADEVNVPLRAVVGNSELAVEVVPESLRPGALDRPVRWAHVSELRDPTPYLVGHELLLTAGVNLPVEQAEVDHYVRRLREGGVTALGFGLTPSMSETLPASLRRACVRHGLPLLVVGPRTPFLAISRAVSVALSEAGQREQRRISAAREALTRAASEGLGELVGALGTRLHCWVALIGADEILAADHGAPSPLPPEVRELLAALRTGSGIRSASTEVADGTVVVAQPVYPQATASHLLVVGRDSRYDSGDRAILAVGAALLGLVGRAGSDAAELGAAATALLLGRTEPEPVTAALVGSADCRLIAGIAHRRGPGEVAARYDWLRARLDTPLVQLLPGPRFVAITAAVPPLGPLRAYGWLAVASGPVPASRLRDATAEVELLLDRARALGHPVVASDLGLDAVVSPGAAEGFAARTLRPVLDLDRAQDRDLVVTLRTWLAHHGGWDRTAAELGVHRNSVRHRIGQVERALDVDLADPEVRMQLWFALRWVPHSR
ncbi:PucR family transcriptional regulator [Amycolatopsis sp. H20-H5]|uniref:PucR family transcriptional regulator n=1 Tax=Amycolatopsis sp. H20-H5 TaxID=3046309 RepID=UPI002DBA404A|nr:PucR family transcriptional regulator [Amycolatopsis sp. H20-H5]MEC3980273.1 PucR family transcriptional regulator [Amycolatopsis sp. H20-H5]